MKKPKFLIGIIAIAMIFSFLSFNKVNAEKYTGQAMWLSEFIDDMYIKKTNTEGEVVYRQGRFIRRSEDNAFVYCIQPFVDINNNYVYNISRSDYLSVINMTEEQWQKATLYAYYGYGYGNHNAPKWYYITQMLIWRTVEPTSNFYFTDGFKGQINNDLYASEISELEKLVSNHMKKPNFNIDTETLTLGNTVSFTDINKVLDDYTVSATSNLKVSKNDNELTITPTSIGSGSITFTRTANLYDSNPVLYYATGTQDVFRVGNVDPIKMTLKFNVIGGKVTLEKLDRDTGESKGQGEGVLANASYGIYDMDGNLITKLITGEDGRVQSDILPYLGKYQIKEITSSKGYELDKNIYEFEITEDNLYPTVTVYEQVIKRPIKIHKYYANSNTGILVPEENIKFEIYDKNDDLVVSVVTDENGYATFNLPYGTYVGKQITTTDGHEKIEDFTIIINESSPEIISLSFSNAPITAKLKLLKIDSESNKTINMENVTFKIKNLETNNYICQKVTYPSKGEICEYKTNENGEFITPYPLTSGKYKIEEITSPNGYLINKEGIIFTIDENSVITTDKDYGNYITVEFANEKIMGEIIVEKTGDIFNIDNGTFSYLSTKLFGIEFSLYAAEDIRTPDNVLHYSKGDLISTVITNEDGIAKFENLYLGKYLVKETKTLDDYVLDTKQYEIELTEIDNKTAIVSNLLKLNNQLKKGTLEFTKLDFINGNPIPNTLIEIYTENDELIFSGKTNENGQIIIPNLKVGKYYIIETESATGYVITDEKVYFEIKEDGEIVKAEMKNRPITGKLEFTKVDFSTSKPLPDTLIEIYTENDELIFSGKTDANGMIIVEELRYGKYYILEKEAPKGYILNTEKMYFEIKEDGEIVKATMVNELIEVEVPNTAANDNYLINIIGGLLIISGIGVFIYNVKKNKRK